MRIQIGLLVMFSTVNLLVSMYCQGADDHRIVLEKGSVALAWAMEPKSTRIFCITKDSDKLIEYNRDGKQFAKHQIVKGVDNLFIKKGVALLSVTAERKLHFFDLKTNQLAGSLDIPKAKEPSQRDQHRYRDVFNKPIIPETKFTASRADNNYVYVFSKNGRLNSGIFKIDISKKVILGEINSQQPYLSGSLYAFEVSRDGKWAALRRSPDIATPMQFDEGKFEVYPPEIASSVSELHAQFDWATFSGKRTLINSRGFSRQFAVQFMKGLPSDDRKVHFSFSNGNFSIRRLKDNKTIFTLREEFSRLAPPTIHYMNVGEKNDFLFLGMSDRARWIDLRQYRKLMNGGVKIVVEKNYKFRLGEKIKFSPQFEYEEGVTKLIVKEKNGSMRLRESNRSTRPLNVADQSLRDNQNDERVPVINTQNSKIVGDYLLWNPGPQDVGRYLIDIEVRDVKSNELLSSAITVFQLGAAEWKLGAIPETSTLDKSGRYAVVWDRKNTAEPTQFRLLDVNLQEEIAEMTVDGDVDSALITSRSIYVAVEGKSSILRYSHQFNDEQEIEIGFAADVIEHSDGSNLLFSNDANVAIYDELTGKFKISRRPFQLTNVDQRLKTISEKSDIPSVFVDDLLVDKYQGEVNTNRRVSSRRRYNKPVSIEEIEKIRMLQLFEANTNGDPFIVQLLLTRKQANRTRPSGQNVSLVSMSDGKTIAEIPFGSLDSYTTSLGLSRDDIKASLMLNRVVLKVGSKFCYQNIPNGVVDSLPIPPRFKENQCGEVTVGKIAVIPLNLKNGSTNLSFRLLQKWPGFSIDPTNGQLTIDTNKVWNSYANSFWYDKTYSELLLKRRRPQQDFTFSSIAKGYQRVTGKQLRDEQTAAKVWIEIEVDNTIEKRQLAYPLILIGPRSALLKKMNVQLANRAAFPFTPIDRDKQEEAERERQRFPQSLNSGVDAEMRRRVALSVAEINRSIQTSLHNLTMSGKSKTDKKDPRQPEAGKEKSLDQLRQQLNQIEADLKAIRK